MDVEIEGLPEVIETLLAMPEVIRARALAKSIDRALGVFAAEVEARAPDGEEGLLKECVITKTEVDLVSGAGVGKVGFSRQLSERTGAPADLIAYWVEFGHEQKSHSGRPLGHVPAHPFMRPAFDAAAERAAQVFADNLMAALASSSSTGEIEE